VSFENYVFGCRVAAIVDDLKAGYQQRPDQPVAALRNYARGILKRGTMTDAQIMTVLEALEPTAEVAKRKWDGRPFA
jgi:hypothetical protein